MQESVIFKTAVKLPPDERGTYLDQACGADAALRLEVEGLLRAHDQPGEFMHRPPIADMTTTLGPGPERPGMRIGPYKLLQFLGEGGMGTVFLAEQSEPVRRMVALKIIKPGMDSSQVLARFEAERQALALMDHPNIARVLDAGATQGEPDGVSPGRPYFVMELIKGVPITEYCDQNKLTTRQRLELFVPVCNAIQHAHMKGIIHRDVKPSNVLIALYDGKPVPKVIDFGVAKAMAEPLTKRTLFTQIGQIVGTFEYMSPEQATLNQLDIDTRSDVYSLGVLLYELLTGMTPLDKERLRSLALDQMLRTIREEEPIRPSVRLSSQAGALATAAAYRGTDSAKLPGVLRGELDWIVMKCLEKERDRRFITAGSLAQDVERYLRDEPVTACPPTVGYRLRKFARKNRTLLVTAAAFAAVLLVGVAVSSWQAVLAMQAEAAAKASEQKAIEAGNKALLLAGEEKAARQLADEQRRKALSEKEQADQARQKAKDSEVKAEWRLYAMQIASAQREWEAGNIELVDRYLNQCRKDFRGFEHDLVYTLTNPHLDLRGHLGSVNSVAFSPDGKLLASASVDKTVKLWDPTNGREILCFKGHTTDIHSVAFSSDSKRLASAANNGKVHVWDAATGKIQRTLDAGWVMCVAFSPDGKLLATASRDKAVRVWDLADGKQLHILEGHTEAVSSVAFSPDGKRIASGSQDRTVKMWDTATGRELFTLNGPVRVAFSPDGKRLASSAVKTVKVWDALNGKELRSFQGHTKTISGIAFSPDGKRLATASWDMTVKVWDAITGQELVNLTDHKGMVFSVAFSPDGRRLATCGRDPTVKLWNLTVDADDKLVVAAGRDSQNKQTFITFAGAGGSFAFSRDGQLLASAENHGKGMNPLGMPWPSALKVWTLATGKLLREFPVVNGAFRWPPWLAFSPDSVCVAGEGVRGSVKLWDLTSGLEVRTFENGKSVHSAAFSPNGKTLASAGSTPGPRFLEDHYQVKLWDVATGKLLRTLQGHKGCITSLSFSRDGKRLVSASIAPSQREDAVDPSMVKLWDVDNGQEVWTFNGSKIGIPCVTFSPDAKYLAAAGWDQTAKILDAANGHTILTLEGHAATVRGVAFSPDGTRLASASADNTVRLWDTASGQNVLTLHGEGKLVAFSPDGKHLAGATDGAIRIWDASKSMKEPGQK